MEVARKQYKIALFGGLFIVFSALVIFVFTTMIEWDQKSEKARYIALHSIGELASAQVPTTPAYAFIASQWKLCKGGYYQAKKLSLAHVNPTQEICIERVLDQANLSHGSDFAKEVGLAIDEIIARGNKQN